MGLLSELLAWYDVVIPCAIVLMTYFNEACVMRINARLDGDSEHMLHFIQQATGQSVTDIIKHALALYQAELRTDAQTQNQLLVAELAGIGQGPDMSQLDYKQEVRDFIHEKYRHC